MPYGNLFHFSTPSYALPYVSVAPTEIQHVRQAAAAEPVRRLGRCREELLSRTSRGAAAVAVPEDGVLVPEDGGCVSGCVLSICMAASRCEACGKGLQITWK